MLFVAAECISTYLWLFAFLGPGWAQNFSTDTHTRSGNIPTFGSQFLMTTAASTSAIKPAYTRLYQRPPANQKYSCTVPPEPVNGIRKLHEHYCGSYIVNCNIAEGVKLEPNYLLNYTCNPGFKISGNPYVLCEGDGNWSHIPVCNEVNCDPLNSVTTVAKCFRLGRWVSCDSAVLQETRAKVSCRPGYLQAMTSGSGESETVECNMEGKWEPDPIECMPVCGVAMSGSKTDFPWHASLHKSYTKDSVKYYGCSATVIRTNLVLTAASCVYDSSTNSTWNSENLFVITGNTFQDYDHPLHDLKTVWRSAVKNVHMNCDYQGPVGDSPFDIALVEIEKPFEFSTTLVPVCLDDSEYGEEVLGPGAFGSIAEFGATPGGRPITNEILSIKTVPYVPESECKIPHEIPITGSIIRDKFCAGYWNESSVCVHNRGGGLVFEKNDLWYVMGIVSDIPAIALNGSEMRCRTYGLYTNVTEYTAWIQDVIFNLERHKSHPPCERDRLSIRTTSTTLTQTNNSTNYGILPNYEGPVCLAPPQPENGEWHLQGYLCKNKTDCKILQGAALRPGSQLVYSCAPGYKASNTDVYCGASGNWSAIPVCTEIKCKSLNSASTMASCYDRFSEWMSCDSPVPPGTRAELSCHLGYKQDTAFTTFRRETVKCNENGEWAPDPIRCVPVCGVAIAHQTPYVMNGTTAKIGDFPWHVTLYKLSNSSKGTKKNFICGATIIQSNFLLTAAHCVYDESSGTTEDPGTLFVMTGNIFRDWDYPGHDPDVVRKSAVKNVYRPCKYYGLKGNFVSDIALLELHEPFKFSGILLPACLDLEGYTEQVLEPGVFGRVAGFGRTDMGASSGILQTLTLPYISYNQCKTSKNADINNVFISKDKFCAGYTNGSAVCEGDSGGGLVFRKSELWYVLGIVSVGLGVDLDNGEKTCDRYSYSLYTKVSEHMTWIQDVMFQRAQSKSYPSCEAA